MTNTICHQDQWQPDLERAKECLDYLKDRLDRGIMDEWGVETVHYVDGTKLLKFNIVLVGPELLDW